MTQRTIIYQLLPRLFGNRNTTRRPWGTLQENGVGKLEDIDTERLKRIREMGCTHVWYTGVLRHATTTDYSAVGLPAQHPQVVKGRAGSPYAIVDYYDIDPDLAVCPERRLEEWQRLVQRTHEVGMGVVMDFVPNHVARQYRSLRKPAGVRDLGEGDDVGKHFDTNNNFYYCPGQAFVPPVPAPAQTDPYKENPARCTGNDCFAATPSPNDWYETVKLNYGVDYCDLGGRSQHFSPIPSTWKQMTDILLYWAASGVDAFRCDMAEMVPPEFWTYATAAVRARHPKVKFIGEVYNPDLYRTYLAAGFDYLYDKVGMYDTLRDVVCGRQTAYAITHCWQAVDDIRQHMLYFLENHDEQRIASDYFCGQAHWAIPAVAVAALMGTSPFMLYAGQEVGERGMDHEGFSGVDGRTTIFDYWCVDSLRRAYYLPNALSADEEVLREQYARILRLANAEEALREGAFFDLMYANPLSDQWNTRCQYAFLRKHGSEVVLVVCHFGDYHHRASITIPAHAFDHWAMPELITKGIDLLTDETMEMEWRRDGQVTVQVQPRSVRLIKLSLYGNVPASKAQKAERSHATE